MEAEDNSLPLVVGLGDVDVDVVAEVLAGKAAFIARPSDVDLARAQGAIVRAHIDVTEASLDAMPRLRVLARTGVGTERVDVPAAAARGIPVAITPGSNTNAVAEGTLAHLLALTKRLSPLTDLVSEGRWSEREQVPVGDLEGGTLAVLGFGRIGRRVASLATAFGMNCVAYDPYLKQADIPLMSSVTETVSRATHVTVHMPASPETHKLINRSVVASMTPGTIVVNLSRGDILDLDAALWGLEQGILGGVGLDVFDQEPPNLHPVFFHPNVVLTPHLMGLSARSASETYRAAAQAVAAVLEGGFPAFVAEPSPNPKGQES